MSFKARIVAAAAVASISATGFVAHWEGEELEVYIDIAGVPTVCSGITKHVVPGRTYTRSECRAMLRGELDTHAQGLAKCLTREPPPKMFTALVSWTFNVGVGAACKSTLVRLVNAGDFKAACEQLPRWRFAGGKEVKGLANRRQAEMKMCLEALQ
jgi:lysozyme